eukprot:1158166-Pelagomonas_calceolata.AAC.8
MSQSYKKPLCVHKAAESSGTEKGHPPPHSPAPLFAWPAGRSGTVDEVGICDARGLMACSPGRPKPKCMRQQVHKTNLTVSAISCTNASDQGLTYAGPSSLWSARQNRGHSSLSRARNPRVASSIMCILKTLSTAIEGDRQNCWEAHVHALTWGSFNNKTFYYDVTFATQLNVQSSADEQPEEIGCEQKYIITASQ